jgi:hypothetical protein
MEFIEDHKFLIKNNLGNARIIVNPLGKLFYFERKENNDFSIGDAM